MQKLTAATQATDSTFLAFHCAPPEALYYLLVVLLDITHPVYDLVLSDCLGVWQVE